jgi:hypothetical protein
MRLLAVELDRFRSRRAVVWMLLGGVLLTVLLAGTAIWDTRPVTDAERAEAESQVATAASDPRLQREQQQCEQRPEDFFGPDATAADCAGLAPREADFYPRDPLQLDKVVDNRGTVLIVAVTGLLVLCGATFAGGDWHTGSVATQLLFRPRRGQVWLAKAGAVALASAVAAGVLVGAFWATLMLTARARGLEVPAGVQADIWWTSARGVALAVGGALGGYALSMLLAGTVATLAVLFGYAVLGEALLLTLPVDRSGRFSLAQNVLAWVGDGKRVVDTDVACLPGLGGCEKYYVVGIGYAAAYLAVLLLATCLLSWAWFRRRDVG